MVTISKELLKEMIEYIEEVEVKIDYECGSCRSVEELIKDDYMPDIYYQLKSIESLYKVGGNK